MAILINPPRSSSNRSTWGERQFAARIEALLGDHCLCWYDVPIGTKRQHPDFIILHPSRGLLLLEVKDWVIDKITKIDKSWVDFLLDSGSPKRVPNPLEQARNYLHPVIDCLSRDPNLCERSGTYQGKICFPYGYGVVLTNITRKQLDERLPKDQQDLVLPARFVMCKDEMTESVDSLEFQQRLWDMLMYSFGRTLTPSQIDRVRWNLFPEIRINLVQKDFFTQEESAEEMVGLPDIVRVMDIQQERLARSLGSGHRVIHGVAGSGKTLILGYRCLHLARVIPKPVLVLCFNVTLAARLKTFAAEHGIADNVHVHHFHGWCKKQLQTYQAKVIQSNKPLWERYVESVIAAVEHGSIPRAQYGAVMIDEGHDFEPQWLKLIVQMVDPASDSLLLLYDDAQSIYKKSGSLKFRLSSVGIKAVGRTTILRLNYRNTRQILELSYSFAKSFISPHSADEDHIPLIEPEAAGASGPKPEFRQTANIKGEIDYAARCVINWHHAGTPLSQIAVICANTSHGRLMKQRLDREGIANLWMETHEAKAAYAPDRAQVSILFPQSSKGLEFKCIIFVGVGHLLDAKEADQARVLYVGMTRAREQLVLTASASNLFTEKLLALTAQEAPDLVNM